MKRVVISLQIPVREHKGCIYRNGGSGFCNSRCVIQIQFVILVTGSGSITAEIFDTDTIGALYNLTPLAI